MYLKKKLKKNHTLPKESGKDDLADAGSRSRKPANKAFAGHRQRFQYILHNTLRKLAGVGGLMPYSLRHRLGTRENTFYPKVR